MKPQNLTWKKLTADELTRVYLDEMHRDFMRGSIGQTLPVLFETEHDGVWTGHSDTYILVKARGEALRGKICPVSIKLAQDEALFGEII